MLVKKGNPHVIRGHCYFDKYGKSIEWQGSQRGQSVELVKHLKTQTVRSNQPT